MDQELMTYDQISNRLGIKVATLYSLVCQRRIPHIRLSGRMVRFRESEIEQWLKEQSVNVGAAVKAPRGGGRRCSR